MQAVASALSEQIWTASCWALIKYARKFSWLLSPGNLIIGTLMTVVKYCFTSVQPLHFTLYCIMSLSDISSFFFAFFSFRKFIFISGGSVVITSEKKLNFQAAKAAPVKFDMRSPPNKTSDEENTNRRTNTRFSTKKHTTMHKADRRW